MTERLLKPSEIADIKLNISNFEGIEDRLEYDQNGRETRTVILSKKYSSLSEKELESIEKYNLKLTSIEYGFGICKIFFKRVDYVIDREIER